MKTSFNSANGTSKRWIDLGTTQTFIFKTDANNNEYPEVWFVTEGKSRVSLHTGQTVEKDKCDRISKSIIIVEETERIKFKLIEG